MDHCNYKCAIGATNFGSKKSKTEINRLVGNTNDELLMNGQLQRTHTGHHDNKTQVKLDWTDIISL